MKLDKIIELFGDLKPTKTLIEVLINLSDDITIDSFHSNVERIVDYCKTEGSFNMLNENYNRSVTDRGVYDYTLFYCLASCSSEIVVNNDNTINCVWNGVGYDITAFGDLLEYRKKLMLGNIYNK